MSLQLNLRLKTLLVVAGTLCANHVHAAETAPPKSDQAASPVHTHISVNRHSSEATTTPKTLSHSHADLAAQATNPVARLIQFRVQNYFIFENIGTSDEYANQFDIQPVIPIPKLGFIPRAIFRPTIPVVTTPDVPGGPSGTTGLGDIPYVYLFAFDHKSAVLGVGPGGAFPTATDDRLGARKWTLGPSVLGMYSGIPHFQMGALITNTWSVGGPGASDVNELSVQPIFNYHFGDGWYTGWGDQAISVDWENGNAVYAPLSFRLGKVYAIARQHMESNMQFIYNVGDDIPGKDQWGLKFTVTLLFPEK